MLILILIPLGWIILPASAQDSPPSQGTQQAPASQSEASHAQASQAQSVQSIGQSVRSNLARAGYKDVQMVPDSLVVRAKDPNGASVMMVLSPDSITLMREAAPAETSGSHADAPPNAGAPAPDRCVAPDIDEGLVGLLPPVDLAFDTTAMGAGLD